MALEIRWTEEAIASYNTVIAYLSENWSEKVVNRFIKKVSATLKVLGSGKVEFRHSAKKNIHEVLVTKHNLLLYKVYPDRVDLLVFWDTRRDPKSKKQARAHV